MKTSITPMLKKHTTGLSLIELMVALVISSLLMLGLVASFKTSSDSQKELEKSGMLIENGRYAVNVLADDLKHAGYYGHFFKLTDPGALPDPCALTPTNLGPALGMPIQGYTATSITGYPNISSTSCGSLLPNTNLSPGSDIVVIRRANTDIFTGSPDDPVNEVYIQSNNRNINIFACSSASSCAINDGANNSTAGMTATVQALFKYPALGANPPYADIRKYHVHVYFVAPCIVGTDTVTDGVCTAADNTDEDNGIPTLKRLELTSVGGATAMDLVPLVEGIEYLKVEYGIDTSPTTVDTVTRLSGDSIPDSYITTPSLAQWPYVVAVRAYVMARATKETDGYTDAKTYTLGAVSPISATPSTDADPDNDAYLRRIFSTEVRPMNLAGRREIPE